MKIHLKIVQFRSHDFFFYLLIYECCKDENFLFISLILHFPDAKPIQQTVSLEFLVVYKLCLPNLIIFCKPQSYLKINLFLCL